MAEKTKSIGDQVKYQELEQGLTQTAESTGGVPRVADLPVTLETETTFLGACSKYFFSGWVNVMLVFLVPALLSKKLGWSEQAVFGLNFLAIIPLAALLGETTEDLAETVGDTLGGLLNATFGNCVEMLLSMFALQKGLVDVVQTSLLGSILSNLLLVPGFCFFLGGLRYKTQKFNENAARTQASLLLLSVLAMSMPALIALSVSAKKNSLDMSRLTAIILSFLYCSYLVFQLKTHPEHFESDQPEPGEAQQAKVPALYASFFLLLFTLTVACCSELLIGSVEGITETWRIPRSFIGGILLPIVGNAAEHATAVQAALKDKMDLAIGVALGSSAQIALLVVPFCVITGWAIDVPMGLDFPPVSSGILLLTVLIVNSVTTDGETNWLEGIMLLAAYVLVAGCFWYV